jgi:hypothetical protein
MANAEGLAEIASLLIRHGAYLGAPPWGWDWDEVEEHSSSDDDSSNL